jgi:ABC-2 type transport system permease protein
MPGNISIFVKKEIKDLLRDPKILFSVIILPALIYIILGQAVSFAITKVAEESGNVSLIVIDNDSGEWSKYFISYLESIGLPKLKVLSSMNPQDIISSMEWQNDYDCLIVIPAGFSHNITSGVQAKVEVVAFVKSLGITSLTKLEITNRLISNFANNIVVAYLKSAYPDRDIASILNPIVQQREVIVKNQKYSEAFAYNLMNQSFLLVLGPILVLSIVTSIAATSMGVEKEEKTLEVLLSLPLKRSDVILGKAIATAVISILGAISLSIGLFSYIGSIISAAEGEAQLAGTFRMLIDLLGKASLIKLSVGLILCLLLGSILGLIVASFASNVREAQALANIVWMPVLIVFVMLLFLELDAFSEATRVLLSVLPFSAPIIVLKTAVSSSTYLSNISIVANLIYFVIAIWLSIKWFDSERILTARPALKLKRK